jgi:hypothetical protein
MRSFRVFMTATAATGAALAALATAGAAQAATNIVDNPGFEAGGALSPWTSTTDGGWLAATFATGVVPNSGARFAAASDGATCTAANPCDLNQDLATAAGQAYDLSFAYNPGEGSRFGSDLQVFWGGALVDDIALGDNAWNSYTLSNLVAASTTTTLTFRAAAPVTPSGVDDVSVAAVAAGGGVPEPAAWALLLTGFATVGVTLRRRRAAGAATA